MTNSNKILLKFVIYNIIFILFYKFSDFIVISAENYNIVGLFLGFGLLSFLFTFFDLMVRWWFTLILTPLFIFTMGTGFLIFQIVIIYVADFFVTYIDIANTGVVLIAIATTIARFLVK